MAASYPDDLHGPLLATSEESTWLAFLSGLEPPAEVDDIHLPVDGFPESSSSHSSPRLSPAQPVASTSTPPPGSDESFVSFPSDVPPIAAPLSRHPFALQPNRTACSPSSADAGPSRSPQLVEFGELQQDHASTHSSALKLSVAATSSDASPARSSSHIDQLPLGPEAEDASHHLVSSLSSFFPPPEPSAFFGPQGVRHEPPHHQSSGFRPPTTNFSFSPTAFSNLLLPDQLDCSFDHQFRDVTLPTPIQQVLSQSRMIPATSAPIEYGTSSVGFGLSSARSSSRGRKRTLQTAAAVGRSMGATDGDDDARRSRTPSAAAADSPNEIANRDAVEDEKRRRNTEASARFRAKKKNHTVHLTRTVSDLTSRVGELEVEAGDLRRENTWLKEIVVARARGKPSGGGSGR